MLILSNFVPEELKHFCCAILTILHAFKYSLSVKTLVFILLSLADYVSLTQLLMLCTLYLLDFVIDAMCALNLSFVMCRLIDESGSLAFSNHRKKQGS